MAKPTGFSPGFAAGFGVGRYRYELAPLVWDTSRPGMPFWRFPAGVVGGVDLRPLSGQAAAGGPPQGLAFVASMEPAGGVAVATSLNMVDEAATPAMRDAWQAATGYRPAAGTKLVDLLWDQLTAGSDPSGQAGPKPLLPDTTGTLRLFVPGHSEVRREAFAWGVHPHTGKVRDLLRRDFEEMWERTNGADHCRRVLDATCEKYGLADWREAVPPRLHAHVPGRLPHATTITESFNKADSDTLGPDLTWAEVEGDMDVVSNRAKPSGATTSTARAEADLSSADHYAQIVFSVYSQNQGLSCRFDPASSSGANSTYYLAHAGSGGGWQLFKRVSGSFTQLASDNGTVASGDTTKVQANGSTIKAFINGVEKHSQTDSAITGHLRCGFYSADAANEFDAFQAADLGGGGTTMAAAAGAYVLTGQAAGLAHGYKVPAAAGTYTLTGATAGLAYGRKVAPASGAYALTGQAATLTYSGSGAKVLAADAGAYTVGGQAAALRAGRKVAPAAGAYALAGQPAGLARGYPMPAASGSYALTGSAAAFGYTRAVVAAAGVYVLTGAAAVLTYGSLVPTSFAVGGSWMLARLRAVMPGFLRRADLRRVAYYPRTTGDTFGNPVGYWARREPQRRAMEDGRIVVRATWHLYRVDDPLQTTVPTPAGKVVDDEGLTWLIPAGDGSVTRGYRDPVQGRELKFDLHDTVLKVGDQTASA